MKKRLLRLRREAEAKVEEPTEKKPKTTKKVK